MPIKIPADLPAYDVLTREGVMVMDEDHAARQDIRPLRIGLLNLMPKKIQTENQFAPVDWRHAAADRTQPDPDERTPHAQYRSRAHGELLSSFLRGFCERREI